MTEKLAEDSQQVIDDLQRRLDESVAHQAATAEVLRVISRSNFDLQTVLETLITSAVKLCGANRGSIFLREGDVFPLKAASSTTPEFLQYWAANPPTAGRGSATSRVIASGKVEVIADVLADSEMQMPASSLNKIRGTLGVPLLRDDQVEGVMVLTRPEPGPFTKSQIDLVQTFADQAMIAIENARLFDEVQAKSADLREALQHQTAASEVLQVISRSPGELDPVFQTILSRASGICEAQFGLLVLYEGGGFRCTSTFNLPPAFAETFLRNPVIYPPPIDPLGRLIETKQLVHVVDVKKEPAYLTGFPPIVELVELGGARTLLLVPMLKENELIGVIAIFRQTVHAFTDKQIELVTSFGSQAVIAIENARLLNETRESLERQTATADILKVIASSPSDVQPVFETIATRANSLVGGFSATVFRYIDGMAHLMAFTPTTPEADAVLKSTFPSPVVNFAPFKMARDGEVTQVPDTEALTDEILDISRARGFRSMVFAPLMNKGASIGLIAVTRTQPGSFSNHHVQVLRTFADQAVIAIENVRLFDEVQAKTRDLEEALTHQTGSASILRVIASSPTDVSPVLQSIVENACNLCDANDAVVHLRQGDELVFGAHHGQMPVGFKRRVISRQYVTGRSVVDKQPIHIHDIQALDAEDLSLTHETSRTVGFRTILSVPMLREGDSVGAIVLRRYEISPFSEKQIALLQTFADQAVIAIGNVRLFEQVEQRTRELAQSLEELRTAQDRLVQTEKLASLGQLTAGIAHEIKNPLNFVNNFSALSGDLIDELNELLGSAAIDDKVREEVDELTRMLKGNLEKVEQHGKRADSIVKNMLLHSREGSGERRSADINAIVEESLNLAYHGARAEKSGFNITLERDLDPAAGMIDLYPQEITRVFLNLISNGFYAASKRKEAGENGFEPSLMATTKNLGNGVEVRIRDNGTGIPAEVKEKMFNPFFTTKPAGEGTGLGLSMSHDIVVKQHGGKIEVDTEPGQFTEFIITLPRAAAKGQAGG